MASSLNWIRCSPLGSGSFGHVSLALNLDDGSLFAAKSAISNSRSSSSALHKEFQILSSLRSPYILRCLGASFSPSLNVNSSQPQLLNHSIFLEYMDGGSLSDLLQRCGGKFRDEKLVAYYTRAILQGLDYLHQNGIVHCDIKSHNILIGSSGVKIADFGAAKRIGEPSGLDGTLRGTPLWMAPEAMQGVQQETASDIWSLGCTVVEMLQGRPPWAQLRNLAAFFLEVGSSQEDPPLPACISVEARDFLLQCLQRDAKARPTAAELLKHPFLSTLPTLEVKLTVGMAEDHDHRPSPRSTLNFVQSDSESDGEELEMALGTSPPSATAVTVDGKGAIDACAELNRREDCGASGEWLTVRCRSDRSGFIMHACHSAGGMIQVRKGCEVSLESAAFLKRRRITRDVEG